MREYDLIFIVHPDLDDTAINDLVERVKGWVGENKGEVVKVDAWGKRKLAYPIRKQTEGHYYKFDLKMAPSACAPLERNLRFLEPIMRFLIAVK